MGGDEIPAQVELVKGELKKIKNRFKELALKDAQKSKPKSRQKGKSRGPGGILGECRVPEEKEDISQKKWKSGREDFSVLWNSQLFHCA